MDINNLRKVIDNLLIKINNSSDEVQNNKDREILYGYIYQLSILEHKDIKEYNYYLIKSGIKKDDAINNYVSLNIENDFTTYENFRKLFDELNNLKNNSTELGILTWLKNYNDFVLKNKLNKRIMFRYVFNVFSKDYTLSSFCSLLNNVSNNAYRVNDKKISNITKKINKAYVFLKLNGSIPYKCILNLLMKMKDEYKDPILFNKYYLHYDSENNEYGIIILSNGNRYYISESEINGLVNKQVNELDESKKRNVKNALLKLDDDTSVLSSEYIKSRYNGILVSDNKKIRKHIVNVKKLNSDAIKGLSKI